MTDDRHENTQQEIDADYENFWKPLVETDGVLDLEKVKRELWDFHVIMAEASAVYMHVTGGLISKPLTCADAVNAKADEYTERLIKEAIEDHGQGL